MKTPGDAMDFVPIIPRMLSLAHTFFFVLLWLYDRYDGCILERGNEEEGEGGRVILPSPDL
jgi:hypothetical protein